MDVAVVAAEPAAGEVARVAALVAVAVRRVDRAAADAKAGLVARAAADVDGTASHATAMAVVVMAEASSSRTSSPSIESPRS